MTYDAKDVPQFKEEVCKKKLRENKKKAKKNEKI